MKQNTVQRVYAEKNVSDKTLFEIYQIINDEDIDYSGDYGLKFQNDTVKLIYSEN